MSGGITPYKIKNNLFKLKTKNIAWRKRDQLKKPGLDLRCVNKREKFVIAPVLVVLPIIQLFSDAN